MKPIYIKMQAFGSYQEECISFKKADHGLFLITGDTGSGKTTIFDAITFALYGRTSGGRRDGKMMRSQYAPVYLKTKVEYKFRYQGSEYTVTRSPKQANWKKRTDEAGKEYYEQLKDPLGEKVELIMPDGSPYLGGKGEVDNKIKEIIGLDEKQFTQIAMLAQGDFIKLLSASSEDRKEIFAKIFDTKIYEDIERETAERAKAVRTELVSNENKIAEELAKVKCIDGSIYAEEWNSDKYHKKFSETEGVGLMELVGNICKEGREKQEQTDREITEAKEEIKGLEKKLLLAESVNKLFDDLNRWEKEEWTLEERANDINALRQKIQEGERALEVERDYNELKQRKEELFQCRERTEELQQWILDNQEKSGSLRNQAETAKEKYERESPLLYAEKKAISESLSKYDELEELLKKKKNTEEEIDQLIHDTEKMTREKEDCEERLQKLSEETKKLKEQTRSIEALENEIKIIESRKQDFLEITKQIVNLEKTKEELRKKEEAYNQALERENLKREEYEKLYQQFISSQAAIIRAELREGEPCPVCGSIHYIYKAEEKGEEKEIVDDKKLKKQKSAFDKVVQEREAADRERNQKEGDKNSILGILTAACKKFYDVCTDRILFEKELEEELRERTELDYKEACTELDKKNDILKETEENNRLIIQNEKNIKELTEKAENVIAKINKKSEQINNFKIEKSAYDANIETLKKQLLYSDKSSALKEEKRRQQILEDLKQEFQNSERAASVFEKEMTEKAGKLASEQENMKRFDNALQRAEGNYKESLKRQKFDSTEEFQTALIRREEMKKIQKEIDDYEKELAVANNNKKRLVEETKGKEKTDITQYKEKKKELENYQNTLEQASRHLFNLVSVNEGAYKNGGILYRQREKLRQTAAVLKSLDDTVNGRLSGKQMNFQTYIQRRYFKQVIDRANKRLYVMSGNQFILQCRDVKNLRAQGKVGLDLDVYSIVNEQTRDVKTLSGGESFMAALALALGMADMVQNSRGSVHIDTMFIDEGFGSLSEDTRNQAIHILNELSEGKRLVGIISHVSELKSQVETKLLVKKTDKGSQADWED